MLTEAQKMRIKELLARMAKEALSDAEKSELEGLKTMAKDAGYEYDEKTGEPITPDGDVDDVLTADQAKALLAEGAGVAVLDALGKVGLDADGLKALKDNLAKAGDIKTLTPEDVQAAVAEAIKAQKADPDNKDGDNKDKALTKEDIMAMVDKEVEKKLEAQRRDSKMVFALGNAPIEHRSGNLTVWMKQLLNVCMSKVSDEALTNSRQGKGMERPKGMNDGISDEQLMDATRVGDMKVKSIQNSAKMAGRFFGGRKTPLTSTGTGTGLEFMNSIISSEMLSRLYIDSEYAALMISQEVEMPSQPFTFPLNTVRTTFYKGVTENTATTDGTPATDELILNARKLIGMTQYSYEADEDAVIAVLPWLMSSMSEGAAASFEDALINGDDSGTHQDSDVVTATDHRALFKGLRYYALNGSITSSFATGGISVQNLGALRKLMKKWGIKPSQLVIVAGVNGYLDIVQLEETLTRDKMGDQARLVTGEAPSLYGIGIVPSEAVREDLNASGVFDGVTETKGSIFIQYIPSWIVGVRKGFTVESDRDIGTQTNKLVASFRRAFEPIETPSTDIPMVAMGFDYDSA